MVAKNEERGQMQASFVRSATVFLPGDVVVTLQKSLRVLVRRRWRVEGNARYDGEVERGVGAEEINRWGDECSGKG